MDTPIGIKGEITAHITDTAARFQSKIENQVLCQWGFSKKDVEKALSELQSYRDTGLTPEEVNYTKDALETEILYSEYWKARALEALEMIQKLKEKNEALRKGINTDE